MHEAGGEAGGLRQHVVLNVITRETRDLRDAILAEGRDRGIDLEQESLVVEQNLPVLRLRVEDRVLRAARIRLPGLPGAGPYMPDVITVHGAAYRSSRTWPRQRDGGFKIAAIIDHLLDRVREELESPRPDPPVTAGVPPAASGLHVIHAAAVLLRVVPSDLAPESLVTRVTQERVRNRIESHLGKGGLTDGDLRALGDAVGLFVSRCMTFDSFDPFEPAGADLLSAFRLGEQRGENVERRYVLLLDRRADRVKLADPSGKGTVEMRIETIEAAWKLGALGGRGWLATMSPARAGVESHSLSRL